MKEKVAPWHELVFICTECGKEFQPTLISLSARLCPQCIIKKGMEEVMYCKAVKKAAGSIPAHGLV